MLSFPSDDDDLPAVSAAINDVEGVRQRMSKLPLQNAHVKEEAIEFSDFDHLTDSKENVKAKPFTFQKPVTTSPGLSGFINRFKKAQLNPEEKVKQAKWSSKLSAEQLAKIASFKPTLSVDNDEFLEIKTDDKDAGSIFGPRTALLQRAHVPRVKRASIDRLNEVLDKRIRLKQDAQVKQKRTYVTQDTCLFDPSLLRKEEVNSEEEDDEEEEEAVTEVNLEEFATDETGLLPKKKIRPVLEISDSEEEAEEEGETEELEELDLIDKLADLEAPEEDEEPEGMLLEVEGELGEAKRKWRPSDFFDEEAESEEEDSEDGGEGGEEKPVKKKKKSKSAEEEIDEKAIEQELSGFIVSEDDGDEGVGPIYQVHQQLEQKDDEARLDALIRRFGEPADGMSMTASRIEAKYKKKMVPSVVHDTKGPSAFSMLIAEELHETIKYSDHLCGQDDEESSYESFESDEGSEEEAEPAQPVMASFTIDLTDEALERKPVKRVTNLHMDARVAERIQQTEQ